jgi:malic enzyme
MRPKAGKILPHPLERKYVKAVAKAVEREAKRSGVVRK